MRITVSTHIDRPVADVWRWYAIEHVRNAMNAQGDDGSRDLSEGAGSSNAHS